MAARNIEYQNMTAVRKPEYDQDEHARRVIEGGRRESNRRNYGYAFFVGVALVITAYMLVSYVSLKSDITNRLDHISELEAQLNDLKLENDATYSRINSNMDLEEIRDTAINELGMTYAKEGQTETFTSENGDYVRQLEQIP